MFGSSYCAKMIAFVCVYSLLSVAGGCGADAVVPSCTVISDALGNRNVVFSGLEPNTVVYTRGYTSLRIVSVTSDGEPCASHDVDSEVSIDTSTTTIGPNSTLQYPSPIVVSREGAAVVSYFPSQSYSVRRFHLPNRRLQKLNIKLFISLPNSEKLGPFDVVTTIDIDNANGA